MPFLRRLHPFLKRFLFLQESAHFLADASKYSMVLAQIYLYAANMWPINFTTVRKTLFFTVIGIAILRLVSILVYCYSYVKNVDTLAEVFQQVDLGIQVLYKSSVVFRKSNRLSNLIHIVWYEFWPSNLFGGELEEKIADDTKTVIVPILLEIIVAGIYSAICLFLPLFAKSTLLLHEAWYPPGWDRNPMFKYAHIFKSFVAVYTDLEIICAYDLLYVILCTNCSAQFRLLCSAMELIGSGMEKDTVDDIQGDDNDIRNPSSHGAREKYEMELLSICVKHHQKLIQFGDELNMIFGSGHFLQLHTTLMGICLTSYLTASADNLIYIIFNIIYYVAHFWQLYVFCAASNQVSDSSVCVFDAAYGSKWYTKICKDITKCLIIIMIRSKSPITMNAFGLIVVNYVLFLTVMRFSFTLYTFLRTLAA